MNSINRNLLLYFVCLSLLNSALASDQAAGSSSAFSYTRLALGVGALSGCFYSGFYTGHHAGMRDDYLQDIRNLEARKSRNEKRLLVLANERLNLGRMQHKVNVILGKGGDGSQQLEQQLGKNVAKQMRVFSRLQRLREIGRLQLIDQVEKDRKKFQRKAAFHDQKVQQAKWVTLTAVSAVGIFGMYKLCSLWQRE